MVRFSFELFLFSRKNAGSVGREFLHPFALSDLQGCGQKYKDFVANNAKREDEKQQDFFVNVISDPNGISNEARKAELKATAGFASHHGEPAFKNPGRIGGYFGFARA
jgi:hypothetical protein